MVAKIVGSKYEIGLCLVSEYLLTVHSLIIEVKLVIYSREAWQMPP